MISRQPSDVFERGFVYLFDFHPVNPYTYVNIYIYMCTNELRINWKISFTRVNLSD